MTWGSKLSAPYAKAVLAAGATATLTALAALGAYLTYPESAAEALDRGFYGAARDYLNESASQGSPEAQNMLGNLYYLGLGGPRNHDLAFSWYLKSAAQADAEAQINLARMYRQGLGVKRDVIRSFAWLRQARINGNEAAENQMRWIAGSLSLAPNQIQLAQDKFGTLESLLPDNEKP